MDRIAFIALVGLCLALPSAASLAAAPRGGLGPFVVLHAPWTDGAGLVRAAGGRAVGPADAPFSTLAAAPDPAAFRARLHAAGAWAVLDAPALSAFCNTTPPGPAGT